MTGAPLTKITLLSPAQAEFYPSPPLVPVLAAGSSNSRAPQPNLPSQPPTDINPGVEQQASTPFPDSHHHPPTAPVPEKSVWCHGPPPPPLHPPQRHPLERHLLDLLPYLTPPLDLPQLPLPHHQKHSLPCPPPQNLTPQCSEFIAGL